MVILEVIVAVVTETAVVAVSVVDVPSSLLFSSASL